VICCQEHVSYPLSVAKNSQDACVANPMDVIRNGKLMTLLPSLYGNRKTGLPHQAAGSGWQIGPGDTPRDELCRGINHGAWIYGSHCP
jgi:PmbA protein